MSSARSSAFRAASPRASSSPWASSNVDPVQAPRQIHRGHGRVCRPTRLSHPPDTAPAPRHRAPRRRSHPPTPASGTNIFSPVSGRHHCDRIRVPVRARLRAAPAWLSPRPLRFRARCLLRSRRIESRTSQQRREKGAREPARGPSPRPAPPVPPSPAPCRRLLPESRTPRNPCVRHVPPELVVVRRFGLHDAPHFRSSGHSAAKNFRALFFKSVGIRSVRIAWCSLFSYLRSFVSIRC